MRRVGKHDDVSATRDPLIGQTIARRFQLERRIGSGGMGFVYRAHQLDLDRKVAVKMLHNELTENAEVKARFHREMRATTRIEHPNSVRVYEYGEQNGRLYLVMELCEGRSLDDLIQKEAPLSAVRTAVIAMQIAQALAAAHQEKIIHRDLKPENVMLVDRYGQQDVVKVLDFGLARIGEDDGDTTDAGRLTQAGVRVGTPTYMAPEYVQAFTFDARSDLYALGVIMYEMCTGRAPYTGRPFEILEQAVTRAPVPPSKVKPDVPPWLERCVLQLMSKNPADRIQTANEVFTLLDRGRSDQSSNPSEDVTVIQAAMGAATPSAPASVSGALAKARRTAPLAEADTENRPRVGGSRAPAPPADPGQNLGLIIAGCGLVSLIGSALLLAVTLLVVVLYR